MKIVFIITGLGIGGAERALLNLVGHIDRTKFEPVIIFLTGKNELKNKTKLLGIDIYDAGFSFNFFLPLRVINLVLLLRALRPEIIQTWMYHADFFGTLAGRLAGTKTIIWGIRNGTLDSELMPRNTLFIAKMCSWVSGKIPVKIISCSQRAVTAHVQFGYAQSKFLVIPNGFDVEAFIPSGSARTCVRKELRIDPQCALIGMIGRYHQHKNHFDFFRIAQLLRHWGTSNIHFLLAGAGVDKDNSYLMALIAERGLESHVSLLGIRDDMPVIMASLDVLVSTSITEGFSNVFGEAMSCGVPCVATNVGDSAEILGDSGVVVNLGDIVECAKGILKILDRKSGMNLQYSAIARKRIIENYDIRKVVKQYEDCYARVT